MTFATLRIYSSSCQVVALAYPPPLNNISPVLHELHKWSLDVRGEQLLHLLHTGYATDAKSYRPISNLSVSSKLLERLVAQQLIDYFRGAGLLPDLQSAYRAFNSTETAVLRVISDVLKVMSDIL